MRMKCLGAVVGCAVVFGGVGFAHAGQENLEQNLREETVVSAVSVPPMAMQDPKAWVKTIKPAAGPVASPETDERTPYWKVTVNRQSRVKATTE